VITVTRLAPPTVEPVFLDDVLIWASVGIADLNATVDPQAREIVRELIAEQRDAVEAYTERALVAGDYTIAFDREDLEVPGEAQGYRRDLDLPLRPVLSVTEIKATDGDGVESLVDAGTYFAFTGESPRISLRPGETWPSDLRSNEALAVKVRAGYAEPLGPTQQASTDTLAVVAGSSVDVSASKAVRYGVEVSGQAVKWTVYGANVADYSDEQVVRAEVSVAAGHTDHASFPSPAFSYYRVKIRSAATGQTGALLLAGLSGAIPGPLRLAVRELVRYHYVYRGDGVFVGTGGFKGPAPSADAIFSRIDLWRYPVVL
jgi:hypothetical protein